MNRRTFESLLIIISGIFMVGYEILHQNWRNTITQTVLFIIIWIICQQKYSKK